MSTSTGSSNGTTILSAPNPIQSSDFFLRAGILHPLLVGSTATVVLFTYLRVTSNRSISPITTFDWLINVALGSTLAGIVNGNSLVRGLLALATMLTFQYTTSMLATRFPDRLGWIFASPPLVIVFRGEMLQEVMRGHRISVTDLNASLRGSGLLDVSQVECAIIEPNGTTSVFSRKTVDEADGEIGVLMAVPAYKALCEQAREEKSEGGGDSWDGNGEKGAGRRGKKGEASEDLNDAADCNC